ncbi:MAG: hypothetical protein IJL16_02475 [Clostridia bacterium]|nr:hypothetical protein [Clostridia bacterium]
MDYIQIVGTKGKGSTSTYIANILSSAGYKTGLFVSPHVRVPNERISINGRLISNRDLNRLMKDTVETGYFRQFFDTSLRYFAEKEVDIAVMEAGMGGRHDATTRLPVKELVITSIGMDHMGVLGDTIEKIAVEKVAAMRMNCSTVSAPQQDQVKKLIETTALYRKNDLSFVDEGAIVIDKTGKFTYKGEGPFELRNATGKQYINACLAIEAVKVLAREGYSIDESHIRKGLKKTVLPARQQYIKDSDILVDGAHNVDSLKYLYETLSGEYKGRRKVLICSSMKDKDVSFFDTMANDLFEHVFVSQMDYDRSFRAEELAELFTDKDKLTLCTGTEDAYKKAEAYRKGKEIMLVFTGSIYQAGEILDLLDIKE